MIPFYRFRNRAKQGISIEDYDFHNEIEIYFKDCYAEVERIDWARHEIKNDDRFEIISFSVQNYTRMSNHIVGYLDKITAYEKIENDDATVKEILPQFTLAQITDFINIANENNATNVISMLLEYKNNNFSDFDPMDEFTLD